MTKRLQHIAPLQLGIVLATLYGIISLIFIPFIILISLIGMNTQNNSAFFGGGILLLVIFPFIYAAVGFIGGIITGLLYNLVAKWSGGIEFTLVDAPQY